MQYVGIELRHTGVILMLNESNYLVEGEVIKFCVSNINSKQSVVRDIPVSLTFALKNITTGKMCKSALCCQSLDFYIII